MKAPKKRAQSSTKIIGVRLSPEDLAALDAFIAGRPDPRPSRPETIREMVRVTLKLMDDGNAAVKRNLD